MALGRVRRSEIPESLSSPHFTEISKSDYSLNMRTLFIIPLFLMSLMSLPSWGLTMNDLVERNGLWYEKFTDVPFNGDITGHTKTSFKDGKFHGDYEGYWLNGQLMYDGAYILGKKNGLWKKYHKTGKLDEEGEYKNGQREGFWIRYNENGT